MEADLLVRGISELVTAAGSGPLRGSAMGAVSVVKRAALACRDGMIVWVGPLDQWRGAAREEVDAGGCAVAPGLVDPHTHAVWAGDRLDDFECRLRGVGYEEILARGGGIRSTIRATAAASVEELVALSLPRLMRLVESGATTIEVKSGYGFRPEAEIKMLHVIRELKAKVPARLWATLLIHVPPFEASERNDYLLKVCTELIPEVAQQKLASAVDVFVEQEAWSAVEAERILVAARSCGLQIKLHTEQFRNVGGVELGLKCGALSLDHLEACRADQVLAIAKSATIGTVLPGVSLHLGLPVAPARQLVDAGAAVAIGTDLNPGSSPVFSVSSVLALSARMYRLTPQEVLTAATVNAAAALGLNGGRLKAGQPADFLILKGADWRDLIYVMGANPVRQVYIGGELVAA